MFDFVRPLDWGDAAPWYAGALLFGYLVGSIPFGLIFARLAGAGDIRKIGSGNIGATNVLRSGKRWAAAATLAADAAKGAVAVIAADYYFGPDLAFMAGLGAFLGHLFPVWLRFSGGKGVATFLGIALASYWPAGLLFMATWLAIAALFRFSSLSALVAAAATPFYMAVFGRHLSATLMLALAVMIFLTHRANIVRLLRGEESRIGERPG